MDFKILNDVTSEILALRTKTFIEEKNVPTDIELDGREQEHKHFCLYEDGVLMAYLRAEAIDNYVHIGRVAVRTEKRKSGYGRHLINYLLDYAKSNKFDFVELSAMDSARGFYEKMGFVAEGEYYLEANIPHIYMKQNL